VGGQHQHLGLVPKGELHAVAVVRVDVHIGDPPEPRARKLSTAKTGSLR
jgi:hypothetical protein